jgi:uncharacterized integral membrane protein (TIGR00697 family)
MIYNSKDLQHHHQLKFYTPLAMLFVSLFIIVNIITQKIVPIGKHLMLTAGDFIYPINYLLSMVLTEVYGCTMSRRIIWSAFVCNIFVTLAIALSIALPEAAYWHEQEQYKMILGRTPRILAASFSAFLVGEFIGTYILAKTKIYTLGKYLWLRTMSATLIGQFIDSIAFTVIAFAGIVGRHNIIILSISAYGCKVMYQILLTPIIYIVADFLKNVDIFDRNTNFNPFNLRLK